MKSYSMVRLATFLIFIAILGQGYAIKCWMCTSQNTDHCLDPFNKTHLRQTDCNEHSSSASHYSTAVCKKYKYRETDHGELITVRKCDWVPDNAEHRDRKINDCTGTSASSHWKIEYCATCTEDGCNGSNRVVMSSTWCALVPSFVYLFSKATQ